MQGGNRQAQRNAPSGRKTASRFLSTRAAEAAARLWRPAGSVLAVGLALLLTWHVVNGRHGLSFWQQKRVEDRQLGKEIDDLQQENQRLAKRIDKLKTDSHAIEREAREKLHYAKPNEIIITLPDPPRQNQKTAK